MPALSRIICSCAFMWLGLCTICTTSGATSPEEAFTPHGNCPKSHVDGEQLRQQLRKLEACSKSFELVRMGAKHDDWIVRDEAARALGRLKMTGEDSLKILEQLLADEKFIVRETAATSAGKLELVSPAIISQLGLLLKSSLYTDRMPALYALADIGTVASLETLVETSIASPYINGDRLLNALRRRDTNCSTLIALAQSESVGDETRARTIELIKELACESSIDAVEDAAVDR